VDGVSLIRTWLDFMASTELGADAVLRGSQLTGGTNAIMLGTLAAAYAEGGRFADAVTTAELATTLAEAEGQKEVAEKNRELLKSYRAGQPWREVPPRTGDK